MLQSPGNGKFVHAVGEAVVLERNLVERDGKSQRRNPPQQCVKHDLKLSARQLLPYALMAAIAEAQLLAGVAAEIQLVGLRVRGLIPVRGGEVDDDALAGADGLTADLDVLGGHPALAVLNDRQVAHQLFDSVGDELR